MRKGSIVAMAVFKGGGSFYSSITLSFRSVFERSIILKELLLLQSMKEVKIKIHHVPETEVRTRNRFNRRKGRKYFVIHRNGLLKLSSYQASRFYYNIMFEIKSVDLLRRIISEINNTLTRCNFIPGSLNRFINNSSLVDIWYFVVNEETY